MAGTVLRADTSDRRAWRIYASAQSKLQDERNFMSTPWTRTKWAGVCLMALATLLTGAARAQELTPADQERAKQYLETTRKSIVEATKGLSKAQWEFKAAPDRWSVAETMEHIAAAEDFIRGMIVENAMKAPAEPGRDLKKNDDAVVARIPDRSHKAQAPEPLKPTNRFGSGEESLKHFLDSRAKTEVFLDSTPDLRQHVSDSPLGMKLDAYEWILFLTAHSERHLKQIQEVKADPNFPKP
jgi:DinB superfamily